MVETLTPACLANNESQSLSDGTRGRFNQAHRTTRSIVERAFGVIKNRFGALSTGFRVKNMKFASKLVVAAAILHNLAIKFGDKMDEDPEPG